MARLFPIHATLWDHVLKRHKVTHVKPAHTLWKSWPWNFISPLTMKKNQRSEDIPWHPHPYTLFLGIDVSCDDLRGFWNIILPLMMLIVIIYLFIRYHYGAFPRWSAFCVPVLKLTILSNCKYMYIKFSLCLNTWIFTLLFLNLGKRKVCAIINIQITVIKNLCFGRRMSFAWSQ